VTRVAVFIDYQNVYQGAREAFGIRTHFTDGQIYPRRAGLLLTDRGRAVDAARELTSVTVFRGEPSAVHSTVGQAACQRQVMFWRAQVFVDAVTRPLKYYATGVRNGASLWEAREKGIDVLIALRMVLGAMRDEYDVAILFSCDTDLVPAVETVLELGKRCEVAAWSGQRGHRSRLSLPGKQIWCHWLTVNDYSTYLCDPTDYTLPQGAPPADPSG
jgi:uncharacterized LabA/DUF88 family protein